MSAAIINVRQNREKFSLKIEVSLDVTICRKAKLCCSFGGV